MLCSTYCPAGEYGNRQLVRPSWARRFAGSTPAENLQRLTWGCSRARAPTMKLLCLTS